MSNPLQYWEEQQELNKNHSVLLRKGDRIRLGRSFLHLLAINPDYDDNYVVTLESVSGDNKTGFIVVVHSEPIKEENKCQLK